MNIRIILIFLVMCTMLGGCNVKDGVEMDKEKYGISVQEYTGLEYPANEKQERWDYIEDNKKDIEKYAIDWFKNRYNLDTKVNHIYPKNGAAIATVEWLNDSALKMPLIMGLDERNNTITGVNTSAMQLENTIMSYITYRVFKDEFDKFDMVIEKFCKEHHLYGFTNEYIENTTSFAAFTSKYYRISASNLDFSGTYNMFIKNPYISSIDLRNSYIIELEKYRDDMKQINEDISSPNVSISLFSKNNQINDDLFKKIEDEFYLQTYMPNLNYVFELNENRIDTRTNRSEYIRYPDTTTKSRYIKIRDKS